MRSLFLCITAGFILFSSSVISAPFERHSPGLLKEGIVQWDNNRLSGQLDSVLIHELLLDLLQSGGSTWQATERLKGVVSIRFDRHTIAECIKKVMNLENYNYTLIEAGSGSSREGVTHHVEELTIFIGNDVIRFVPTVQALNDVDRQVPIRGRASGSFSGLPAVAADRKTSVGIDPGQPSRKADLKNGEMPDKIKDFVDDLLKDQQITKDQYDKALSTFGDDEQ